MINTEVLEKKTKNLFDKLSEAGYRYPLVWWTWLSLQLWHRKSIDLDFAKNWLIEEKDIDLFKKISRTCEIVYKSSEQINLFVDDVKVTVFSYWRKNDFQLIKYNKLNIWNIKDIAISKCYTIWRREEYKDYVDLYFVMKDWILSLSELLKLSKNKYWWDFSEKLFLKQLLLVENIEDYWIKYLNNSVDKLEISDYFNNLVKKFLSS